MTHHGEHSNDCTECRNYRRFVWVVRKDSKCSLREAVDFANKSELVREGGARLENWLRKFEGVSRDGS